MRCAAILLALLVAACGNAEAPRPAEPPARPKAAEVDPVPPSPPVITTAPPTKAEIQARYTPHLAQRLETGDAAEGVTQAMAACFGQELGQQDAALNAEYRRIQRLLPQTEKARLRADELAWITRRNETCAAQRQGGTIDQINVLSCLLDQTVGRTIDLERMGVR